MSTVATVCAFFIFIITDFCCCLFFYYCHSLSCFSPLVNQSASDPRRVELGGADFLKLCMGMFAWVESHLCRVHKQLPIKTDTTVCFND